MFKALFGKKPTKTQKEEAGQQLQVAKDKLPTDDLDNISQENVFPGKTKDWHHVVFADEKTAAACATIVAQRINLDGIPTIQAAARNYNASLGRNNGSYFFRIPEVKYAAFKEAYIETVRQQSCSK